MQTVFEIVQARNRSAVHVLPQRPLYSVINRVQVLAVGSHIDGSMNFNKTFFFVCERHSTCKQFGSL